MGHEQDIEGPPAPWAEIKKVLTCLTRLLAIVAAVICLIAFIIYHHLTAWHCLPTTARSPVEIPNVGEALSAWQTSGPVYYRYRPTFGRGYDYVVAGVTSPEAIAALGAVWPETPDYMDFTKRLPPDIAKAAKAFSSVPGFTFEWSEDNLCYRWRVHETSVSARFDAESGWFVAWATTRHGMRSSLSRSGCPDSANPGLRMRWPLLVASLLSN